MTIAVIDDTHYFQMWCPTFKVNLQKAGADSWRPVKKTGQLVLEGFAPYSIIE